MGPEPLAWARGALTAVSIDADFFTEPAEQRLVDPMAEWLGACARDGVPVDVHEDHVAFHDTLRSHVDLTINFDYHMDMRLEFLLGAPAAEPSDPTVFETVLAHGATTDYVWAHPASRAATVAEVYSAAFVTNRQPLLRHIHGLPGGEVLGPLAELDIAWVFLCRSPVYATTDTDAAFARLCAAAGVRA